MVVVVMWMVVVVVMWMMDGSSSSNVDGSSSSSSSSSNVDGAGIMLLTVTCPTINVKTMLLDFLSVSKHFISQVIHLFLLCNSCYMILVYVKSVSLYMTLKTKFCQLGQKKQK